MNALYSLHTQHIPDTKTAEECAEALSDYAIKLEAERDALKEALNDLLNDCINFDDGNLTEAIMKRASDLLKHDRG